VDLLVYFDPTSTSKQPSLRGAFSRWFPYDPVRAVHAVS
jgi:hypothetical protein